MRARLLAVCMAGFSVAAMLTGIDGETVALWSAGEEYASPRIQIAHGTASAESASALLSPVSPDSSAATDPQEFMAAWDSTASVAYTYDADAAATAIVEMIQADSPAPGVPRTYTVSSAVGVDADVYGRFGLDVSSTLSGDGTTDSIFARSVTSLSLIDTAEDCEAHADATALTPIDEFIPHEYGHKQGHAYVCLTQSYTPYVYQNTVTATNGSSTVADDWWGVFIETDPTNVNPVLTIQLITHQ